MYIYSQEKYEQRKRFLVTVNQCEELNRALLNDTENWKIGG